MNVLKDSAKQIDSKTISKLLKYVRFTKIQQTFKRWTLYEDRIKDLSKRLRTQESPRELVRQSEAKRKQVPQREANVCRRRRQMQSRKNLPYKLYRVPNNAQNTQHKLGVAFSYLERNNK